MRWPVLLTLIFSAFAVGVEQAHVSGQITMPPPGIARACGGHNCGGCRRCRPRLFPRLFCRRCRRNDCGCPPIVPPAPVRRFAPAPGCAAPAPAPGCAAPVPQATMKMVPRRVATWDMVPQTRCRRVPVCEQVPVTTYRRVVTYVPQTSYRNVVRYQTVQEQRMVPRRRYCIVWEPRCVQRPVPCAPAYNGCTDFGGGIIGSPFPSHGGTMVQPGMNAPQLNPSPTITPSPEYQPDNSVPSTPRLDNRVPAPADIEDDESRLFKPWSPGQSRGRQDQAQADPSGYRTLKPISHTATRQDGPRFSAW